MTLINEPIIPLLALIRAEVCDGHACESGFTCDVPFECTDHICADVTP